MGRLAIVLGIAIAAALALWLGGVLDSGDAPDQMRAPQDDEDGTLLEADAGSPELETGGASQGRVELPAVDGPHVTGVVVDEAGAPIAGAHVVTYADTHKGNLSAAVIESGEFPGATAVTDTKGRFAVGVSPDAPYHEIAVRAKGFGATLSPDVATGAHVRVVLERAATLSGRVQDTNGVPVAGAKVRAWIMVDAYQLDLEATADAEGRYRLGGLPPKIAQGRGGYSGYWRKNWFEVRGAGHAPLLVEDVKPEGTAPALTQDFTLSRGATLTGRVTDAESGDALAGARVVLYSIEGMSGFHRPAGGGFSCPFAPRHVAETTSDENGAYRFDHVPCRGAHASASHNASRAGKAALGGVLAWRSGYSARGARLSLPDDGEALEASIELWPAARIRGRVLYPDGSAPPEGAVGVGVTVKDRSIGASVPKDLEGIEVPWARTVEADGTFLVDGVPASREAETAGMLTVYPRTPGRRGWTSVRYKKHEQPVSVRAGEILDVGDLVLGEPDRYPTTTVVVHTPDGTPFFGATVVRGNMGNPPRTDVHGRITWIWWKHREDYPHKDIEVLVRAKGYAPTAATLHPPGSGKETVTITLAQPRRVAGVVLRPDGTPAGSVNVHVGDGARPAEEVFPAKWGTAIFAHRHRGGERAMPLIYGSTQSEADGRFAFETLPEGPYHVVAVAGRRVAQGPGGNALRALQSGVASDTEDVELRLPRDDSPPVGTLEGSLLDAKGRVPPNVRLAVKKGSQTVAYVFSGRNMGAPAATVIYVDAKGGFRLDVPAGTYTLRVLGSGYRTQEITGVEVVAGQTTRVPRIQVDMGVSVSGHVRVPDGVTPEHLALVFERDGTSQRAPIQKNGAYRLTGLAAGTYRVAAHPQMWTQDSYPHLPEDGAPLVIPEGTNDVSYDTALVAGAWLQLLPTDVRLPPARHTGKQATATQTRFGEATRVVVTGPDGVIYEHRGVHRQYAGPRSWLALPPGRYTARLEMPEGEVREVAIDLQATKKVEVRFDP